MLCNNYLYSGYQGPSKYEVVVDSFDLLPNRISCPLLSFFFLLMALVTTRSAVVLSVLIGVGGKGCPMEIRVFLIGIACVELRNRAPSSDSAADDMIAL